MTDPHCERCEHYPEHEMCPSNFRPSKGKEVCSHYKEIVRPKTMECGKCVHFLPREHTNGGTCLNSVMKTKVSGVNGRSPGCEFYREPTFSIPRRWVDFAREFGRHAWKILRTIVLVVGGVYLFCKGISWAVNDIVNGGAFPWRTGLAAYVIVTVLSWVMREER